MVLEQWSGVFVRAVESELMCSRFTATFVWDVMSYDEPEGRMLHRAAEQFLEEPTGIGADRAGRAESPILHPARMSISSGKSRRISR